MKFLEEGILWTSRIDDEKEHRWNGGNLEFVDRGRRYSLKMEFFYFVYRNIHMYLPYENKTESHFSTNNTNKNSRMTNILIRKRIGKEYFSTNYILHLHNVNTWKFPYPTFQTKTQNSTCKSFVVQNLICQSFSRALSLNSERTNLCTWNNKELYRRHVTDSISFGSSNAA